MSLFDIDRHNYDRGNPAPNHSDSLTDGSIKAHKTISSHYTSDADTNTGRLQMQNKQVLGNDGTTNVTLYGYNQALNKWGFFATKPGVEVTTNTDLSQFIFNSSQDVFKIVSTGTATLVIADPLNNGATSTVSVAHVQSSPPAVIAYLTGSTNPTYFTAGVRYPLPTADIAAFLTFSYNIDATNVNFYCKNATGGNISSLGTVTFKYYILQETAV